MTTPFPEKIPVQPQPASPNGWTNFQTGSNVKTLAFEGGYLWMGLPNGGIRFDTDTADDYKIFTTESTEGGLISRGIYIIAVDHEKNKWIGTYGGGLTKYNNRSWKTYTIEDGLGDQWVYDVVFDKNNTMWVATWKGVSVFDGEEFKKTYREEDGLADKWVYSIALDNDGIFWFGTESGVSRFDPKISGRKAWKTYNHENGLGAELPPPPLASRSKLEFGDASPVVLIAEEEDDEYSDEYSDTGGAQHHMDPTRGNVGSNPNFVIAAIVNQSNHKWFGTWGAGLSRFDGSSWTTYTQDDGLGGNFVHALGIDQEGYLWAGTNGGASWFDGKRWQTFSEKDGLLNNNVFSMIFDSEGRRWFGTWVGLSMYQGQLPTSPQS